MTPEDFGRELAEWFEANKRPFPWRQTPTPYRVWVSEVMLQQTVVSVVARRFPAWIERFPDAASLASASQSEVVAAWEGMGYYRRAINLHRAARRIADEFGGDFPRDPMALRSLPGIGGYTAAAILNCAYEVRVPAIDANVRRVMHRFLPQGKASDEEIGRFLVPAMASGGHRVGSEALMELGQLVCLSSTPMCDVCPIAQGCRALAEGDYSLPVASRATIQREERRALVLLDGDAVALLPPGEGGLFAGLWLLPVDPPYNGEPLDCDLERPSAELQPVIHTYTNHRCVLLPQVYRVPHPDTPNRFVWRKLTDLEALPFPSAHRKIIRQLAALNLLEE